MRDVHGRFNPNHWELEYRNVVIAFGVPSEVLIAKAKDSAQGAAADAAKQHD